MCWPGSRCAQPVAWANPPLQGARPKFVHPSDELNFEICSVKLQAIQILAAIEIQVGEGVGVRLGRRRVSERLRSSSKFSPLDPFPFPFFFRAPACPLRRHAQALLQGFALSDQRGATRANVPVATATPLQRLPFWPKVCSRRQTLGGCHWRFDESQTSSATPSPYLVSSLNTSPIMKVRTFLTPHLRLDTKIICSTQQSAHRGSIAGLACVLSSRRLSSSTGSARSSSHGAATIATRASRRLSTSTNRIKLD